MVPDREQPTNYELYRLLLEIRSDVKTQNGKVNAHETRITVLEDRGTRDDPARWGAFLGSVANVAIHFLFKR